MKNITLFAIFFILFQSCVNDKVVEKKEKIAFFGKQSMTLIVEKHEVTSTRVQLFRRWQLSPSAHTSRDFYYSVREKLGNRELTDGVCASTNLELSSTDILQATEIIHSPNELHYASTLYDTILAVYHLLPKGKAFATQKDESWVGKAASSISWESFQSPHTIALNLIRGQDNLPDHVSNKVFAATVQENIDDSLMAAIVEYWPRTAITQNIVQDNFISVLNTKQKASLIKCIKTCLQDKEIAPQAARLLSNINDKEIALLTDAAIDSYLPEEFAFRYHLDKMKQNKEHLTPQRKALITRHIQEITKQVRNTTSSNEKYPERRDSRLLMRTIIDILNEIKDENLFTQYVQAIFRSENIDQINNFLYNALFRQQPDFIQKVSLAEAQRYYSTHRTEESEKVFRFLAEYLPCNEYKKLVANPNAREQRDLEFVNREQKCW